MSNPIADRQAAERRFITKIIVGALILLAVGTAGAMIGCPAYNVYTQRMTGQAALAKSQAERQVQIQDAKSRMEAATFLAQADTIRAHGVAAANAIIGHSLRDNEAYLRWLWIEAISDSARTVIYVPTETSLPILEAGQRPQPRSPR